MLSNKYEPIQCKKSNRLLMYCLSIWLFPYCALDFDIYSSTIVLYDLLFVMNWMVNENQNHICWATLTLRAFLSNLPILELKI